MEIVMWADLQCPFCLVGEADLMNAIRELGIEDQVRLDIKTYEVHRPEDGEGDQQMAQIFQNKEGFTHDGAIRHIAAINAMEKEEAGYDIDFGKVRESTDFDAHRLYKFAMDHGKGQIVRDLLHKAYFKDCKVLADRKVLLEAAKEAGLDLAETEKMLDSDLYKREVRNDEMEFRALGIESVPYFIIDTEVIPEHLPKDKMVEVLKRHLEKPVLAQSDQK